MDIKEQNADFEFCPALVIGRDANSQFGSIAAEQGLLQFFSRRNS